MRVETPYGLPAQLVTRSASRLLVARAAEQGRVCSHGRTRDHVVVAPAGIFTVETKAILGKVETRGETMHVNGRDHTDYLRQAYAEAMTVRDYLRDMPGGVKYFVTPLIAFTRANVFARGRCRGVYAMRMERVGKFVSYDRERLDWKARSRVAAALNLRTTKHLSES